MESFKDKVILITGGSSGIGAATGRKASASAASRTAREGRWHGARGRRIYGRNRVE